MMLRELERAVDEWVTSDPVARGHGYHNSQKAWDYNPAIEWPRAVFLEFLERMIRAGVTGSVLQIGLRANGGTHAAFRMIGSRVLSVEIDPMRVDRVRIACGETSMEQGYVVGDSADSSTLVAVRAVMSVCDLLVIDGRDTYEGVARDWELYSPLVRPGGVVAIVDRSQLWPSDRRMFDVDRFVIELQKRLLDREGLRMEHLGFDCAIHYYRKTSVDHEGQALGESRAFSSGSLFPSAFIPTPKPQRRDGELHGFATYSWEGRYLAIESSHSDLDPRGIERNEYDIVLAADTEDAMRRTIEMFALAEPVMRASRAALCEGDIERARGLAEDGFASCPKLRETLLPSLKVLPHQRELLRVLEISALFGGRLLEGLALARKLLEQDRTDSSQIILLANAYVYLKNDDQAARELMQESRERVRSIAVTNTCMCELSGHVLWEYPQLLAGLAEVIVVGGNSVDLLACLSKLRFSRMSFLEPDPGAFEALRRRLADGIEADVRILDIAAGERTEHRELWSNAQGCHRSLMRVTDGCAARIPNRAQVSSVTVEVRALDELVVNRYLEVEGRCLMIIDVEGAELEVLQGARKLLEDVDLLCVNVIRDDFYMGEASADSIRQFLGGCGFMLRVSEPDADGMSSQAIFTRPRRRVSQ